MRDYHHSMLRHVDKISIPEAWNISKETCNGSILRRALGTMVIYASGFESDAWQYYPELESDMSNLSGEELDAIIATYEDV